MDFITQAGTLAAILLTLFVYSYLVKDNVLYRFAEYTSIGFGAAYSIVIAYERIISNIWNPLVNDGRYILIIPTLAGILFLTRLSRKYMWMSRYSLAVLIGVGSGYTLRVLPISEFVKQIQATMLPLFVPGDAVTTITNLVLITGSFASFFFFLLTRIPGTESAPAKVINRYGRYVIMVAMGSQYGNTVFARLTYVIGRMNFILQALGII